MSPEWNILQVKMQWWTSLKVRASALHNSLTIIFKEVKKKLKNRVGMGGIGNSNKIKRYRTTTTHIPKSWKDDMSGSRARALSGIWGGPGNGRCPVKAMPECRGMTRGGTNYCGGALGARKAVKEEGMPGSTQPSIKTPFKPCGWLLAPSPLH